MKINRSSFKDRIIDNVAKSIKAIQEIQIYHMTEEPVVLTCDDRPARKLIEHLDHAFLHGLHHITNGYWKIVKEFTTKGAVREIERLANVATDLGRGRAWLSMALNEGLMESYLRCFEGNLKLVKKYYVKDALVFDQQRLNVLLTLISGIEFVVFHLDYDVPYLDLTAVPQHIRNREDSEESDRLSLSSMDSVASIASKNLVTPNESPPSIDENKTQPNGHLVQIDENVESKFDRMNNVIHKDVEPDDTSIEVIHVKRGSGKAKKTKIKKNKKEPKSVDQEHNLFDSEEIKSQELDTSTEIEHHEQYQKIDNLDKDVKPFYKLTLGVKEEDLASPTEETNNSGNIILNSSSVEIYDKSLDVSEKSNSDDDFIEDDYLQGCSSSSDKKCDNDLDSEFSEKVIKEFQNKHKFSLSMNEDLAKCDLTLSSLVKKDNLDNTQNSAIFEQSEDVQTSTEIDSTKNHEDSIKQLPNRDIIPTTNEKSSTSEMQDLVDSMINQSDVLLKHHMYEEEPEDTELDDSLSKSQELNEGELKLDNNTLLYLMLDVFDTSEEQFVKVFATTQGHTDGECIPVFLTLTDRAIYFLNQKQSDHRFYKDVSIPFTSVDYISIGVYGQALHIVCMNRRNQYWITTGNQKLTNAIVECITTTCHQSGIAAITIDTDATTQKIALKKYINNECSNDMEQTTCCYSLVHWDTPSLQGVNSETLHREGHLLYKIYEPPGGSFIGSQILQIPVTLIYGQSWKPAYVILKDGLLCIYNDKNDSKPTLFLQVGGEDCTGCRRATDTDRDHCIQIIKSDGSSVQLALASGLEASDWLQSLCQVVAEGLDMKQTEKTGCMSCCLVLSPQKILMCHEDLQSSFYRTLGSASVVDITSILQDPVVKMYCVLVFESHDTNVSNDHFRWYVICLPWL